MQSHAARRDRRQRGIDVHTHPALPNPTLAVCDQLHDLFNPDAPTYTSL